MFTATCCASKKRSPLNALQSTRLSSQDVCDSDNCCKHLRSLFEQCPYPSLTIFQRANHLSLAFAVNIRHIAILLPEFFFQYYQSCGRKVEKYKFSIDNMRGVEGTREFPLYQSALRI